MRADFLSYFTPSLMSAKTLEDIFVQREELAQEVVEVIAESALTPSKHYSLLIGPRGIGKTHLVSLIYHRVCRREDLRDRLRVAWLREEEWGVSSFLDLLLRLLTALQAEYKDAALAEKIEALYSLPAAEAEQTAAAVLKGYVGERALLVLAENLNDLFEGMGEVGQKRLRSFIQEDPFWIIIATAQSLFKDVSRRTSPFYGFFTIHLLEDLSLDDATALLTKIADLEDKRDLCAFIQAPMGRARIRAVHHLAGGNPRVYVIFSQFLTREALDELVDPFMHTLDELTPYYQAKMKWLSPQQRKIVDFLCDHRGAVPVKEIAKRCFVTHQTASGQLQDLRAKGYVVSEAVGRESYYELREPLMRMCIDIKKSRGGPIKLVVDFLRLWYTSVELRQHYSSLLETGTPLEREYVQYALDTLESENDDPRVAACQNDLLSSFSVKNYGMSLRIAEELVAIRGAADDWMCMSLCLLELNRLEEAVAAGDQAAKGRLEFMEPGKVYDMSSLWLGKLVIDCDLDQLNKVMRVFDMSDTAQPDKWMGWFILTGTYMADITVALLCTHNEKRDWKNKIADLLETSLQHDLSSSLAVGLMTIVPSLLHPAFSDSVRKDWLKQWQEAAAQVEVFGQTLRLMEAAVVYMETHDDRVLLCLSAEEREIARQLLSSAAQKQKSALPSSLPETVQLKEAR